MSDRVCQLRIGDGREEVHDRSAASLEEMLPAPDHVVIVNDANHELGFAGAIAEGWRQIRKLGVEFVWHAEMDFLYYAPVPLDRMIHVLKEHPRLVQLALKRQPCNDEERIAGGYIEADPDAFEQAYEHGDIWIEHRKFFTSNPCLYPAALCAQGWPQESESEGKFTHRLLGDPEVRFGIWGAKYDPPLVEHIGERMGVGY